MAYYNRDHAPGAPTIVLCDACGTKRFGTSGDGHYGTGFVWSPRWSMQLVRCADCGAPADPAPDARGWEMPCIGGLCAPHHSLGCGHSPRDVDYYGRPA